MHRHEQSMTVTELPFGYSEWAQPTKSHRGDWGRERNQRGNYVQLASVLVHERAYRLCKVRWIWLKYVLLTCGRCFYLEIRYTDVMSEYSGRLRHYRDIGLLICIIYVCFSERIHLFISLLSPIEHINIHLCININMYRFSYWITQTQKSGTRTLKTCHPVNPGLTNPTVPW